MSKLQYYLLTTLLVFLGLAVTGILIRRARQYDYQFGNHFTIETSAEDR